MKRVLLLIILNLFVFIPPAQAYIAVSAQRLTLPEVMLEFPTVVAITVDKHDAKRGAFLFRVSETIQGKTPATPIKHAWLKDNQLPAVFADVKTGTQGVMFIGSPDNRSLTFINGVWFISRPQDGWERLDEFRDDFRNLFVGTSDEFIKAARTLSRGGKAIVPIQPKTAKPSTNRFFVQYDADFPHRRFPAINPTDTVRTDGAQLTKRLQDADPAIRQQATLQLHRTGQSEQEIEPLLIKRLTDEHPEVRIAAAYTAGQLSKPTAELITALAKALSDEDRFVCGFAAWALGRFGSQAKSVIPKLHAALAERNYDHDFRPHRAAEAAEAMILIDPTPDNVNKAIAFFTSDKMLNDERVDSEGTRTAAANALGRCGEKAKPALPNLVKRLTDPLAATRIACARAISRISPNSDEAKQATAMLLKELANPTPGDLVQAMKAVHATRQTTLLSAIKKLEKHPVPEISQLAKQIVSDLMKS